MDEPFDLTERQQQILVFITEYQQRHGFPPAIREIGEHFGLKSPGGIHRILTLLKEKGFILAESGKKRSWRSVDPPRGKGIPVLGAIAAGRPIEAVSLSGEQIAVSPDVFDCDNCFALRVSGDSMIDAHILEGDLAIIRPQQQVENGEIAAVIIQEMLAEATLKIVRRNRRTLTLAPANNAYSTLVFKGAECGKVRVLGKYVGIIRKTRGR